jgi:AraC-like DNA-binding protein
MRIDCAPRLYLEPSQTIARRRSMIVTPDRIVYSGLLGTPTCRMHGAHTVYIAHETPFAIAVNGGAPERAWLATVPANQVHVITSSDRLIRDILIEPETAALTQFTLFGGCSGSRSAEYLFLEKAFDTWLASRDFSDASAPQLDDFFFGTALPARTIDPRIERVVARIRALPHEQFSAAECARLTDLSFSRFVHLFKQEIGMTFRAFCAWKRARAVLPLMTGPCNLTHLALEAGYPDSTHFSHSIRRIFGMRPRDILAGTRRLSVLCALDNPPRSMPVPSPRGTSLPHRPSLHLARAH